MLPTGIKFVLVGAVNTGLSYLIYLLCLLVLDYRLAYVLSFASGIVIALVLNSKYVFHARLTVKRSILFVAAYCFQLMAGIVILQILVEKMHIALSIAPLCAMVFTVPLSFFLSRYALKRI